MEIGFVLPSYRSAYLTPPHDVLSFSMELRWEERLLSRRKLNIIYEIDIGLRFGLLLELFSDLSFFMLSRDQVSAKKNMNGWNPTSGNILNLVMSTSK